MSNKPRDTQLYTTDDLKRGREILRELRRLTYMPNEELAIFLARVIAAERNAAALSGNENCVGLSEAKQQAPRSSMDVTAWLIEPREKLQIGDAIYYLSLDKRVLGFWTKDHNVAMQFARKVDAENWIASQETIDSEKVHAVEHMWIEEAARP